MRFSETSRFIPLRFLKIQKLNQFISLPECVFVKTENKLYRDAAQRKRCVHIGVPKQSGTIPRSTYLDYENQPKFVKLTWNGSNW